MRVTRGTGFLQGSKSNHIRSHYLFTLSQIYVALIGIVCLLVAIAVSFAVTTPRLPQ
jgi:hypothetical protein